jgi:hypothetical protein
MCRPQNPACVTPWSPAPYIYVCVSYTVNNTLCSLQWANGKAQWTGKDMEGSCHVLGSLNDLLSQNQPPRGWIHIYLHVPYTPLRHNRLAKCSFSRVVLKRGATYSMPLYEEYLAKLGLKFPYGSRKYLSRYNDYGTDRTTEESWFDCRRGKKTFLFFEAARPNLGPSNSLFTGYRGLCPRE